VSIPDVAVRPIAERIEAIDFVRGVALFGILLMNITGVGLPEAYHDPTNWGGSTGADLWAWIIVQIGLEGTQRGLFSILFGAGLLLFTDRLEAKGRDDAAMLWLRRTLILAGFGLFNAYVLLWAGDILFHYGMAGLVLFWFRHLAGRTLVAAGAAALLVGLAWNLVDARDALLDHERFQAATAAKAAGQTLGAEQNESISSWQKRVADMQPPREELAREVEVAREGYRAVWPYGAQEGFEWHVYGLTRYPHDILGMMLIGMGLLRLGVLTGERSRRLYAGLALAGYAVGLTVNTIETAWILRSGFSVLAFIQTEVTYDVGRLATTLGHLGALLWIAKSGLFPRLRRRFVAVGRMALTNYLSHSLICLIFFISMGFYGQLGRAELYLVVLAIWAFQLWLSPWWLAHYQFGPVEWLWRALTYGARPRLRRVPAPVTAAPAE
jgi:uncharacterized protein